MGRGQDLALRAVFRNIQAPDAVDQFGIFVGSSSISAFRIGVLTFGAPQLFTVQTVGNFDNSLTLPSMAIAVGFELTVPEPASLALAMAALALMGGVTRRKAAR